MPTYGGPYGASRGPSGTLGLGKTGSVWFSWRNRWITIGDALARANKQDEACCERKSHEKLHISRNIQAFINAIFSRFMQLPGEISDGKAGGNRPKSGGVPKVVQRRAAEAGRQAICADEGVASRQLGRGLHRPMKATRGAPTSHLAKQ